jgi:hypothetical protein
MTNGHAADPVLRSHTLQYCSNPDYPWDVLRRRRPAVYEAHADVTLGAWTHVKMNVRGTEAKFYVGTVAKPSLIVHGLLRGDCSGRVALFVAGYTKAYFANFHVSPA